MTLLGPSGSGKTTTLNVIAGFTDVTSGKLLVGDKSVVGVPAHKRNIGVVFQQIGFRPAWYTSAFGAHLTWTLPFGVLIMFAVFNRFSPAYEEAARDLGATAWQTFAHVVLPMIAPSLIGVGLFGFTLSYDEFARTLMTSGTFNTLPLEIYGMTTNVTTPVLYALGTVTTVFSFLVILLTLGAIVYVGRRRARA
ncbi:MAG: ABC transporter permease subunit [Mesorhizobium sp.]|nr:MAG: ABC transporter permease subunit [Mesorhizobium sp.]